MRTILQEKSGSIGRYLALVLVLGFLSASISLAQPAPPPEGQLTALADEVIAEASQALSQTLFAWTQSNFGNIEAARASIHDAINSIEGPNGEHFDPQFGRPSGQGAIPAATRLLEGISQMQEPDGGVDYVVAGENVVLFLNLATDRALIALDVMPENQERASEELRLMQGMLMAARGSSEEKDRPTEGGARTIKAWLEELGY